MKDHWKVEFIFSQIVVASHKMNDQFNHNDNTNKNNTDQALFNTVFSFRKKNNNEKSSHRNGFRFFFVHETYKKTSTTAFVI